jgi:8-oxo-dGTP diphosphatase
MFDAHGGGLVSFHRLDDASFEGPDVAVSPDCSLVVVLWNERVLLGFNVNREQWELPGGSLEPGESAQLAALRELAEETSIQASSVTLVAKAELTSRGGTTKYSAALFVVVLGSDPELVASDELSSFLWWNPADELFDGQNPLDAEIARRVVHTM